GAARTMDPGSSRAGASPRDPGQGLFESGRTVQNQGIAPDRSGVRQGLARSPAPDRGDLSAGTQGRRGGGRLPASDPARSESPRTPPAIDLPAEPPGPKCRRSGDALGSLPNSRRSPNPRRPRSGTREAPG